MADNACKICGLPKDLCVCESISRESQKIEVRVQNRRFGKMVTVVNGLSTKDVNVENVTKKLKNKLACGGTSKEGIIELQGDHRKRIKPALIDMGFPETSIDVR